MMRTQVWGSSRPKGASSRRRRIVAVAATILCAVPCVRGSVEGELASRVHFAAENTVRKARTHAPSLASRDIFRALYLFCRTGTHLETVDTLLSAVEAMQDRQDGSDTFGNFWWYWRDGEVTDRNAVDFAMETGVLLLRDHMAALTSAQRQRYQTICVRAVTGSLLHRVQDSYTNIAIVNAVNLILLGEALDRREVFTEGVKRLDDLMFNMALFGVSEYASPCYTAVDLDSLHRLQALVRDTAVRKRAETLLHLFWTDTCASTFSPAGRLGGANSRTYDYLYGRGQVLPFQVAAGILKPDPAEAMQAPLGLILSGWRPGRDIVGLATRTPREIVAFWGEQETCYRLSWMGRHVALGVAGANYWNMDVPLAVDLCATNRMVRGYFIPDARHDPYGAAKIAERSGPHRKALHLTPFWCGVQRGRDVLGLVVYRAADCPAGSDTLESHFVFPSDAEEILVDERPIRPVRGRPFSIPVSTNGCLIVRNGDGAFGVRLALARDEAGGRAAVEIGWDDKPGINACRLTVVHRRGAAVATPVPAAAAFWVRVCDEAGSAGRFAAFRSAFRSAASQIEMKGMNLAVRAEGEAGTLALSASDPFDAPRQLRPRPGRVVFSVDGQDIGKEILNRLPALRKRVADYRVRMDRGVTNEIVVVDGGPVRWEAESGFVVPKMAIGTAADTSGGHFVWTPPDAGGTGVVSWRLNAQKAGDYWLWGLTSAPSSTADSFFVSVHRGGINAVGRPGGDAVFGKTAWHLWHADDGWKWRRFHKPIHLPCGPVLLTLHTREAGAKLDALFLSPKPGLKP